MIDVLVVDRWSSLGRSWLHLTSTPAKLLAALVMIGLLVLTYDVLSLAVVCGLLICVLASTRLPLLPVVGLAVLPIAMSGLFATTRLGGTWESALVILEKGTVTSLTMLLLVASTPRTDLFQALRRVMPRTLADMVVLAYRSVFILLGRALAAREALRLRGGRAPVVLRIRRNAVVAALAVLRANELATEQYAAMRLRGYPGKGATRALRWSPSRDTLFLTGVAGTVVFVLAIAPMVGALASAAVLLGLFVLSALVRA